MSLTIPHLLIAGVTSTDTDFVVTQSPKQRLLADARITDWFATRDGDASLSSAEIVSLTNRKAGRVNALRVGTGPTLATSAAYGGRKAAGFTDGVDRRLQVSGIDLTGTFFIAALVAKSKTTNESFFGNTVGGNLSFQGLNSGSSPFASLFQFFRGSVGINIPTGVNGLDTTPRLIFGGYDGTLVKGAKGRGALVSSAAAGAPPTAGSALNIGSSGSTSTPYYPGGSIAQLIVGNVDIFHADNADLRELICQYVEAYYGLAV